MFGYLNPDDVMGLSSSQLNKRFPIGHFRSEPTPKFMQRRVPLLPTPFTALLPTPSIEQYVPPANANRTSVSKNQTSYPSVPSMRMNILQSPRNRRDAARTQSCSTAHDYFNFGNYNVFQNSFDRPQSDTHIQRRSSYPGKGKRSVCSMVIASLVKGRRTKARIREKLKRTDLGKARGSVANQKNTPNLQKSENPDSVALNIQNECSNGNESSCNERLLKRNREISTLKVSPKKKRPLEEIENKIDEAARRLDVPVAASVDPESSSLEFTHGAINSENKYSADKCLHEANEMHLQNEKAKIRIKSHSELFAPSFQISEQQKDITDVDQTGRSNFVGLENLNFLSGDNLDVDILTSLDYVPDEKPYVDYNKTSFLPLNLESAYSSTLSSNTSVNKIGHCSDTKYDFTQLIAGFYSETPSLSICGLEDSFDIKYDFPESAAESKSEMSIPSKSDMKDYDEDVKYDFTASLTAKFKSEKSVQVKSDISGIPVAIKTEETCDYYSPVILDYFFNNEESAAEEPNSKVKKAKRQKCRKKRQNEKKDLKASSKSLKRKKDETKENSGLLKEKKSKCDLLSQRKSRSKKVPPLASSEYISYFGCSNSKVKYSCWIPPQSPYKLVQEILFRDPWKLLVASIFLNRTPSSVATPVLWQFFEKWSSPQSASDAYVSELSLLLQPMGLANRRARTIIRFSREYMSELWKLPEELHGIGKYGMDSYRIFCLGEWRDVHPTDLMLKFYHNWLCTNAEFLRL
ncbi:uncharacterized protein LOC136037943 isoform X2 [Artemia franciscana]|uniref:Methyl-CpG-binding domain protein 4 n=1 Tax=Artemia franciscana TaxID=6661 RepID=A0AA88IB22_ARTSF|nr:hypothetical protein QYM36_005775 [Artemia franciscana]